MKLLIKVLAVTSFVLVGYMVLRGVGLSSKEGSPSGGIQRESPPAASSDLQDSKLVVGGQVSETRTASSGSGQRASLVADCLPVEPFEYRQFSESNQLVGQGKTWGGDGALESLAEDWRTLELGGAGWEKQTLALEDLDTPSQILMQSKLKVRGMVFSGESGEAINRFELRVTCGRADVEYVDEAGVLSRKFELDGTNVFVIGGFWYDQLNRDGLWIQVRAEGYLPFVANWISIADGDYLEPLNVYMEPFEEVAHVRVEGRVQDVDGRGVRGATCVLVPEGMLLGGEPLYVDGELRLGRHLDLSGETASRVQTDSTGGFVLQVERPGSYELFVDPVDGPGVSRKLGQLNPGAGTRFENVGIGEGAQVEVEVNYPPGDDPLLFSLELRGAYAYACSMEQIADGLLRGKFRDVAWGAYELVLSRQLPKGNPLGRVVVDSSDVSVESTSGNYFSLSASLQLQDSGVIAHLPAFGSFGQEGWIVVAFSQSTGDVLGRGVSDSTGTACLSKIEDELFFIVGLGFSMDAGHGVALALSEPGLRPSKSVQSIDLTVIDTELEVVFPPESLGLDGPPLMFGVEDYDSSWTALMDSLSHMGLPSGGPLTIHGLPRGSYALEWGDMHAPVVRLEYGKPQEARLAVD